MTVVKKTLLELLLLSLASVGVALAANEIRERKSIALTKNYFDPGKGVPKKVTDVPAGSGVPVESEKTPPAGDAEAPPKRDAAAAPEAVESKAPATPPATPSTTPAKKHFEHDYQSMTLAGAKTVFEDPQTAQGLNVFIDARDEERYAEGHIPGAIQCFPYEIERCLDRVVAASAGAAKVVVYCGGGDCEDSIFMCRELVDAGVPYEAVYLFEGGWKEWSASGLPSESRK